MHVKDYVVARKQKITKSLSSDYKVGYQNIPHKPGFIVRMVISGVGLVCEAKRLDSKQQQQQIKMAASQNTPVVYDGPMFFTGNGIVH